MNLFPASVAQTVQAEQCALMMFMHFTLVLCSTKLVKQPLNAVYLPHLLKHCWSSAYLKRFEMFMPRCSAWSVEALSQAVIYGYTNMSDLLPWCKKHEDYSFRLSLSIHFDRWQDTNNYQPPRINHKILSRSSPRSWWNNHFQAKGTCPVPLNLRFVNLLLKPP